jgi:hypothetical protein
MSSSRPLLGGARLCALLLVLGCSGTDVGYPRVSEEPACPEPLAPTPSGGASAAGTSAAPSGAGGSLAGTGGVSGDTNGAGTSSTAGSPVAAPFRWPGPFEPSATAGDGHHNAGTGCMSASCHGGKVPFLFGGTIYRADGKTSAPNVQVGISDGVLTVTAYSASNGNIWLPSSAGQVDFANAQIAIRSESGERTKPPTAGRGAACNGGGCHGATMRLIEP